MFNNDIKCDVCGENSFTPKDGFYFCDECGTQSQIVRQVEVAAPMAEENGLTSTGRYRITQIKGTKKEDVLVTTWECFNYVLHGLVEELIELGAKEELKLTTLQLWSAYLRRMEVAFFSKRGPELPRLGVGYSRRDAKILYNHQINKKKKQRQSVATGRMALRKQKQRLFKSQYESMTETSFSTMNTTANSSRTFMSLKTTCAVPLNFSAAAKKHFKKFMQKSHLKKHANDDQLNLECHKLNGLKGTKYNGEILCRRTLYTILYMALNLIGDEMQLADILRFAREGHLTTTNVTHFFPDNVTQQCTEIIHSKNYFGRTFFYSDSIRKSALRLCRIIHISELNMPNLNNLIERYVKDLNLPKDLSIYIKRLITICPPEMKLILTHKETPCYEGRAMAYIIFILKLIFGLDGKRENEISESSKNLNRELKKINKTEKRLFVFNDWVQYIEMRNIIISQCHLPTSLHIKEYVDRDQYINHLKTVVTSTIDEQTKLKRANLHNMEGIFEELYNLNKMNDRKEGKSSLQFAPSLTPYSYYLEEILSNYIVQENVIIPQFMYTDHSELDIYSYLNPSELKSIFNDSNINLIIERLSCNSEVEFVDIFKNFPEKILCKNIPIRKINHDIDQSEWLDRVRKKNKSGTSFINNDYSKDSYKINRGDENVEEYINNEKIRTRKRKASINISQDISKTSKIDYLHDFGIETDVLNVSSFQVFDETNMEPLLRFILDSPRRNLDDSVNMFSDTSDDEKNDTEKSVIFKISNPDYWCFFGDLRYLTNDQISEMESKFQPIFLWLLKTCANMIEVDVKTLYQELLIIESNFMYNMELVSNKNYAIKRRKSDDDKDILTAVKAYDMMW